MSQDCVDNRSIAEVMKGSGVVLKLANEQNAPFLACRAYRPAKRCYWNCSILSCLSLLSISIIVLTSTFLTYGICCTVQLIYTGRYDPLKGAETVSGQLCIAPLTASLA